MKINNVVCDACGKVLKGIHGMVQVNKENFAIRGMITRFSGDGDYIHITDYAEQETSFCDVECFKQYCNRKIDAYEARRLENLKREASDNIVYNRNATY